MVMYGTNLENKVKFISVDKFHKNILRDEEVIGFTKKRYITVRK